MPNRITSSTGTGIESGGRRGGILPHDALNNLFRALRKEGYKIVGPTVANQAVVYDELADASELPWGWADEQAPGTYRLVHDGGERAFGFAVGPHSWKRYLFPPERSLWRGRVREDGHFDASESTDEPVPTAFIGVRACEVAAIEIQDRVFLHGPFVDEAYRRRRERSLIVAVQCTSAASTCFCSSMGTGPDLTRGYDIALTELVDVDGHRFLVEAGSDRGRDLLDTLALTDPTPADIRAANDAVEQAAASIVRHVEAADAHDVLLGNLDHPQWDDVADRCLGCTNCTLVCPTCFCSTVEDVADLTGRDVERRQVWDSCFTADHSYLHGGSVRASIKSRYRQWLTHKLATWIDQFGTSGCVGCGRCITWCPVGIDLTAELDAFRTHPEHAESSAEAGDA